ncbi:MAG: hypothetical protein DRG30_10115, partial [Epsilonproteobacteria bacterium]
PVFTEVSSSAEPTAAAPIVVSWQVNTSATGVASEYNIYKETNGIYGQVGVAYGTSFDDIGIQPNTIYTPPSFKNPYVGTGNYPSTVTFIQQRLAFGNTYNDPEQIKLSRTANFKNFTQSSPSQSDDSITFTMAGREVNAVKSMLDLGSLVILTTGGEWNAKGDSAGILKPTDINLKQYSYNGSGSLPPIVIDGAAIFLQSRGSIMRDLSYNYEVAGYSGNDLTIFSSHLVDKYTITDWAYQQIPQSILWAARSDGVLLGLTMVRNQQVLAWHRHEISGGFVENVTVIPDGNEDMVYLTVRRTINGLTKRYIERLTTRQISDIVDSRFMDSCLTYDGRNTGSRTMTLSGGSTWAYDEELTLTASSSYFTSLEVGNAIHLEYNGDIIRCTIQAYTSGTVVTVTPHKTVPSNLRSSATTDWSRAVDILSGLWHLEGEEVSVFGDGFVVASPNNDSYTGITVSNGSITLEKAYSVIHVGLPYISDIETLDIDTPEGESKVDLEKNISRVTLYTEDTRGVWSGGKPPTDDSVDPLEGLTEFKIRSTEDYDSPVSLRSDRMSLNIQPEWNSNGRVFLRQIDPIPMTILSINPSGKF